MTTNLIVHGNSLDVDVAFLVPPTCIITDPPYGKNFRSRRAATPEGKRWVKDVENDGDLDEALLLFGLVFKRFTDWCAPEAEAYIFTSWDVVSPWIKYIEEIVTPMTGFTYKMLLVWDKGIPGMGDIDANWGCGHELILYLKRGRRDLPYRRSGIIAVDKVPNTQHIHPTEKPVALIEKLVEMSTSVDEWVIDPFSGSGSTSVACQKLGRNSFAVELDEQYIEPSRARLAQSTIF